MLRHRRNRIEYAIESWSSNAQLAGPSFDFVLNCAFEVGGELTNQVHTPEKAAAGTETRPIALGENEERLLLSAVSIIMDNKQESSRGPPMSESALPASEFEDGIVAGVIVWPLEAIRDHRGWLVELFRSDELPADNLPAMAYLSETLPGVLRGPHEHEDQDDLFLFVGPGDFELFCWDIRPASGTWGKRQRLVAGESAPSRVLVPKGVVHAYRNISSSPGWVFNAPNRLYRGRNRSEPVDEIRHENSPDHPFRIE